MPQPRPIQTGTESGGVSEHCEEATVGVAAGDDLDVLEDKTEGEAAEDVGHGLFAAAPGVHKAEQEEGVGAGLKRREAPGGRGAVGDSGVGRHGYAVPSTRVEWVAAVWMYGYSCRCLRLGLLGM